MFSRPKVQTDVKKSTAKFLDLKKDVPTRLKHLKLILDVVDITEAKILFASNYSHIYHLVYEGIIYAESNFKSKGVHRAQREELESVLQLLERVFMLLPDLLHCRWQLHSIARLMAKVNHPGNALTLRKHGIRLFIMWYQCLGAAAPNYVHSMFAALVPGLPGSDKVGWPPPSDTSLNVAPYEITPVMPVSSSERLPEDTTSFFMELLLDCVVSQAPRIHWNEGSHMWSKSIDFLYEKIKELYLPRIFPNFQVTTDIYKPTLELPEPRKSADLSNNVVTACQVVFIKWIANYAHSVYRTTDYTIPGQMSASHPHSLSHNPHSHDGDNKTTSTPPSSLGDRDSIASYSSINTDVDANVIAKDVFLGTRANINFLHEVFRRALLMNFVQTLAIRRVICVYKDWIQMNVPELPVFMLEPEEGESSKLECPDTPKSRLRTDSYYGAVGANNNKEECLSHLRAGSQNVLRIFFCNSASVFMLFQIPKHEAAMAFLEEQVDICKRVLNIYRYAVMNTRMTPETWEQLLAVLLHITAKVLDTKQSHFGVKNPESLGAKLASALFQTLIVSWVKASLNVSLSVELWDQLQSVLVQLTFCDDLVTEWSKTMETLTRVLARHVYNLDLSNLPLDRLSEQKRKRKIQGAISNTTAAIMGNSVAVVTEREAMGTAGTALNLQETNTGTAQRRTRHLSSDRKSVVMTSGVSKPTLKMRRSVSEGNLSTPSAPKNGKAKHEPGESLVLPPSCYDYPEEVPLNDVEVRQRKKSRSMDSIRTLRIGSFDVRGLNNPDWAEISTSATSLENTSTIHIDDSSSGGYIKYGTNDATKTEIKGVISGGSVKGWLPSVAAILWRRMLGILGNVNEFSNPKTHAHFFQVITDIWSTLYKLRLNQDVSLDNMTTPKPSELCPPLTAFASWCFQALDLPDEYYRGKVLACALLCDMTMANQDIPLDQEYLTMFYGIIHKSIISNQSEIVYEIVRRTGCKFVSKMLPGYSLLLLDLCQASHAVLIGEDLKRAPRMEAATVLGTVLTASDVCKDIPILKPNSVQFQVTSHPTHDVVLSCLLQFAKAEQTAHARAVCLQALTVYLCKEFVAFRNSGSNQFSKPGSVDKDRILKIHAIFSVLLASLKVANRSVAVVATDLMLLLSEFATEVSTFLPSLIPKIILSLKQSLQQALPLQNSSWKMGKPVEMEKRLLISLLMTVGEWCMKLPYAVLLTQLPLGKQQSLLVSVFEVLHMAAKGFQIPGTNEGNLLYDLEDFDANIPFDDLRVTDPTARTGEKDTSSFLQQEKVQSPSQDLETVKLAARSLVLHLMTQLNHYPMGQDSSKCGSVLSENDDLSHTNSLDLTELNSNIFSLPNVQMFALNNDTLLSIVELPLSQKSSSGSDESFPNSGSGFATSLTQVRLILRDLSGKASWDATQLFSGSADDECYAACGNMSSASLRHEQDELHYLSTLTGHFLPQTGPRLNVRRRYIGVLPSVSNSADDYDNLDDLLSYVGHTSPECLQRVGEQLNVPRSPPQVAMTQENEDEVVGTVVNQKNTELEFLMKFDMDVTMKAVSVSQKAKNEFDMDDASDRGRDLHSLTASSMSGTTGASPLQFMLSRRLFSQLGLTGWEKRDSIHVLNRDERLLREIKNLDTQKCRETHKIAVIYVAEGQEDKRSILSNAGGSEAYEDFVAGLGWEVDLETHIGFLGGLQRNKTTGETAPYYATSLTEVIFHVSTRMPSSTDEHLLQKTRHLGNDEVHIVWSENKRDYRRDIIPTEFCDVLIVIYPLKFGLFRVQINRKPEVPYFGPLYNEAVVEHDVLPLLVRATAINASRAKKSSLPFFQYHFEDRAKSLATIINNYKSRTTFENFASSVFYPLTPFSLPSSASFLTSGGSHASDSFSTTSHDQFSTATTLTATESSPASSAAESVRRLPFEFTPSEPRLSRNTNFLGGLVSNASSSSSPAPATDATVPHHHPKKLSIKLGSGLKHKLRTPPTSPVITTKASSSSSNIVTNEHT